MSNDLLLGYKDVDRLILEKLSDKQLIKMCKLNKTYKKICDDNFFKRLVESRYSKSVNYKKENVTWRYYYLDLVKHVGLLKEHFEYNYKPEDENPILLYLVMDLPPMHDEYGEELEYSPENAFISVLLNDVNLEIIKYLVENQKADVNYDDGPFLEMAINYNELDVVKYLISRGANLNANHISDAIYHNQRGQNNNELLNYLTQLAEERGLMNQI